MATKSLFACLICILLSFQCLSQKVDTAKVEKVILNELSIVTDSNGNVIPYSVWESALLSFEATIKRRKDKEGNWEFVFHYINSQERPHYDSILNSMPKPEPGSSFTAGRRFPKLKATDIYGNKISTKDFRGKIVVINYWFIKCAPCRKEIPLLNKIVNKYNGNNNVVFIAICLDNAMSISEFIKSTPFNYVQIDDGKYYADENNINSFPTNVVLDQNGKVYFHSSGFSAYTPLWIKKSIEELLNKVPVTATH